MTIKLIVLVGAITVLTGCVSANHKFEAVDNKINEPVECKNAQIDIMYLKEARSSTQEKLANGVATILPTSAIFNLLSGQYKSRKAIATGELNQVLYDRIMFINEHCQLTGNLSQEEFVSRIQ